MNVVCIIFLTRIRSMTLWMKEVEGEGCHGDGERKKLRKKQFTNFSLLFFLKKIWHVVEPGPIVKFNIFFWLVLGLRAKMIIFTYTIRTIWIRWYIKKDQNTSTPIHQGPFWSFYQKIFQDKGLRMGSRIVEVHSQWTHSWTLVLWKIFHSKGLRKGSRKVEESQSVNLWLNPRLVKVILRQWFTCSRTVEWCTDGRPIHGDWLRENKTQ